jgi:hypothetical protein
LACASDGQIAWDVSVYEINKGQKVFANLVPDDCNTAPAKRDGV